jgi:CheY-like chemotaxis protein
MRQASLVASGSLKGTYPEDGTKVFAGNDFLAGRKEFLVDANANQKLCIAVDISEQIASPLTKNGEGQKGFAMSLVVSVSVESPTPRMTANLLLIDDNAVQAATRQTILKRAGYFVIAALNPSRALEQFQRAEFPDEIHLVITDHLMPGMSGSEFVRILRKTHPRLPVLVISGLEEAEDEYKGLDVTFRMKPLLPDRLLETVERMIEEGGRKSPLPAVS